MSATNRETFHAQLASVVEVLANTAVAEICRLVDDGYAVLRLEISHNQREIDSLRRKLLVARIQSSRRAHLDRLGALKRTGHVIRCVGRSRSNADGRTTRQNRQPETPVVVKTESVESSRLPGDIQPPLNQVCETSISSTGRQDSRSVRAPPEKSRSLHKPTRDVDHMFQSHPPLFSSQPSSETVNWINCCLVSNSDGVLNRCTTSCLNNNSFTTSSQWTEASADAEIWSNVVDCPHNALQGKHFGEPPHIQSPGRTETKSDGSDAVNSLGTVVPSDLGNVVPSLACSLDWKPDGVVQGSVSIKEEEDASLEWGVTNRDTRSEGISDASRRQRESPEGDGEMDESGKGGERREETDAANTHFPPPLRNAETTDGTTENYFQSTLENIKALSSTSSLSSSSSSVLTADKSARQVLHPQSNRGGGGGQHHFRCELCGKTFAKFPSLRRHQRVHTGEKPFGCRHCSKRFSHRHQMKNHERVHTGEKPFRCPVCGRCFVQSNHMKRHLSIHAAGDRAMS